MGAFCIQGKSININISQTFPVSWREYQRSAGPKQTLFRHGAVLMERERENHLVEVRLQSCCTKCEQEEESFGSSLVMKYVVLPGIALLLCFGTSGAFLTLTGTWQIAL